MYLQGYYSYWAFKYHHRDTENILCEELDSSGRPRHGYKHRRDLG